MWQRQQPQVYDSVANGKTVRKISAGGYHACIVASDNQAYCWGGNSFGQLGNNSTTDSALPVAVSRGEMPMGVTIQRMSLGRFHTCAVASDRQVYCWGQDSYNQIGGKGNRSVPTKISNLPNFPSLINTTYFF